jgi:hypothetical protein
VPDALALVKILFNWNLTTPQNLGSAGLSFGRKFIVHSQYPSEGGLIVV